MLLIEVNDKLMIQTSFGTETIHVFHTAETMQEVKEDIYKPFLVAEECGNSARLHLVMEQSEDEALHVVIDSITNEGHNNLHLIHSEQLKTA